MPSPRITELPTLPVDASDVSLTKVVTDPIARLSFWAAIALPFLHLPLLATGLEGETTTVAFVVLLALNVVTLVIGHYHGAD
jgi:hypothetical protein